MPIRFDKRNKRYRFEFDRYIQGPDGITARQRTSRLLPKGWSRAQADDFDQREGGRLYDVATGAAKPEPLIDEAVLLYLKHKKHLKSFANIERELNAFSDIYAGKPFSALPDIARDYAPARVEKVGDKTRLVPLMPATIKNRLSYLRAACRYAWKKHGLGEHDPAEKVELPQVKNERQVYIDRRQFLKAIRFMKPGPDRAAVRIAFYSGMRAGEVGQCEVYQAEVPVFLLPPEVTKNGRPRAVPIHPKLAHVVRNPDLWPMPRTKWTVSKRFKAALRQAGLGHARLHDMRHSTASEMINGGADLHTVGEVLGHLSPVSTRRYAHLVTGSLAAAVNLVGKKKAPAAKARTVKKSRTPAKKKAA